MVIKKVSTENYFMFGESEGEIILKRRDFLKEFTYHVFTAIVCAPQIFRFFNVEISAILKGSLAKIDQKNYGSSCQSISIGDRTKQRRCYCIIPREARHYEILAW